MHSHWIHWLDLKLSNNADVRIDWQNCELATSKTIREKSIKTDVVVILAPKSILPFEIIGHIKPKYC